MSRPQYLNSQARGRPRWAFTLSWSRQPLGLACLFPFLTGTIVLPALCAPGMVRTAQAQSATKVASAQALFDEAVTLAKNGEFRGSIEKFQASYELDPALGTLLGLAMAEQEAKLLASALGHYAVLRDLASRAADEERASIAAQRLAELGPRVPRLLISASNPVSKNTRLLIDGETVPVGILGSELPLDPGPHKIHADCPGFEPFEEIVDLSEGAHLTVLITLKAITPPRVPNPPYFPPPKVVSPQSRWTPVRSAGVVMGGVGVVLGVIGTALWIKSGNTYDSLVTDCASGLCPRNRGSDIERGRTEESLSKVAWVLGGASLVTGGVLLVLGKPGHDSTNVGVSPAGIALSGRF